VKDEYQPCTRLDSDDCYYELCPQSYRKLWGTKMLDAMDLRVPGLGSMRVAQVDGDGRKRLSWHKVPTACNFFFFW
jgi:hypothetical protein